MIKSKYNQGSVAHIITQHAEEAAFLWLLRSNAIQAPHYSLDELAELDNRVEAHLDGLKIAGDPGWEICTEVLDFDEPGEVFTAALLAFENGNEDQIGIVLEAGSVSPELSKGIISALGWIPYSQAEKQIHRLMKSESPNLRRMGIAASAIHRQDPGQPLIDALSDSDALLKARALKAAGELGRIDLLSDVQTNLQEKDEKSRYYAAWSATLLGDKAAESILCDLATANCSYAERACTLAMCRMALPEAHEWQRDLASKTEYLRLAVIGASAIGDPVLVPWLFEQMTIPEVARIAGEAFTMLTGIDLADNDLEGKWPEGFQAGPTEDPEDEDVAMDADEDLPWPDVELVQNWWQDNSSNFQNGARHLLGKPITPECLQQVLRAGKQRQRSAAALELALQHPGQPLFEVRAPGFRQKQLLNS